MLQKLAGLYRLKPEIVILKMVQKQFQLSVFIVLCTLPVPVESLSFVMLSAN